VWSRLTGIDAGGWGLARLELRPAEGAPEFAGVAESLAQTRMQPSQCATCRVRYVCDRMGNRSSTGRGTAICL